ncbi:hypothetical protein BDR04DRAFT_1100121 [Suillus decipiens]|nr:hypothetical protein BDR04DRAFT_1100121 [Suillus decipiens]
MAQIYSATYAAHSTNNRAPGDEAIKVDQNSIKRTRHRRIKGSRRDGEKRPRNGRSERYAGCSISVRPEIHEQVGLARTYFMYLLWP